LRANSLYAYNSVPRSDLVAVILSAAHIEALGRAKRDEQVMRRTVEVGYPRGEETRTRILNVALSLFGTKGFDGVSTREIAAAASVPANSLRYYFGNKQDLYVACLNHTQTLAFTAMEPALVEAELLLEDQETDILRLIDAFCALQASLIDYMIGGTDGGTTALFIVRHDLPSEGGAGRFTGDGKAAIACWFASLS
jgi:TetR/AcrR family transcriptional regulator, regulator of cefoperazone and chloramphenicol sensitivity